jgi:hypothetical protein
MFPWSKVIDRKTLKETISNDPGLLDTVIELFKQQSEDTLLGMSTAIKRTDAVAFGRAAHDLKNIGRSVACSKLIVQSQELEKIASENQLKETNISLKATEKLLNKALIELISIRKHWK